MAKDSDALSSASDPSKNGGLAGKMRHKLSVKSMKTKGDSGASGDESETSVQRPGILQRRRSKASLGKTKQRNCDGNDSDYSAAGTPAPPTPVTLAYPTPKKAAPSNGNGAPATMPVQQLEMGPKVLVFSPDQQMDVIQQQVNDVYKVSSR